MQFSLIPIRRKNFLWTRSSDSIAPICVGLQRTEENSRIGLTKEVYKVLRQVSLSNSFVLRIMKPRLLSAFEHKLSMLEENYKLGWNTTPRSLHEPISMSLHLYNRKSLI